MERSVVAADAPLKPAAAFPKVEVEASRLAAVSSRAWKERGANGKGEDQERCGARSGP